MATAGPGGWRAVCEACGQVVKESTGSPVANSQDVEGLAQHGLVCPNRIEGQGPISRLRIDVLGQPGTVRRGRITED